jgi:hypothetical protein
MRWYESLNVVYYEQSLCTASATFWIRIRIVFLTIKPFLSCESIHIETRFLLRLFPFFQMSHIHCQYLPN